MFKDSLFSGILIGLSGLGYLSLGGIPGAIIFAFGLMSILILKLPLYTGIAGTLDYRPSFLKFSARELSQVLFGNLLGCSLVAALTLGCKNETAIINAELFTYSIIELGIGNIILRSIICGLIIDVSVYLYTEKKSIISILLGVPLFILVGGLHTVADAYYLICGHSLLQWKILIYYPLIIIGNFIGCNIRRLFANQY